MKFDTKNCRVMIVDDHALFRAGLIALLTRQPGISVVGEVGNGQLALELLKLMPVDLVILDIAMPGMNGLTFLTKLQQLKIKARVVVLSMHKNPEYFRYVMARGAAGYIPKDDVFDQVLKAIEVIMAGGIYVSPAVQDAVLNSYLSNHETQLPYVEVLTRTEVKVLTLIASGKSNKEAALQLRVSTRTVETHRAHILRKINGKNTASLVQYAIACGLVSPQSIQ